MTASISLPARVSGGISADRVAGFGPLFRKELSEWAHSKRPWVIVAVTTAFMTLAAANAAINSWIIANVPDATTSAGPISLDPMTNVLAAVSSQIFVVVAIFAAMSLLVAEHERGTLSWVASKPVSRGAIWLSKWAAAAIVVSIVAGIIPLAATFGLVAVLYGPAGVGALAFAAVGVVASIAFITAVVLAVSTVIPNQAAVAAIGFAVFFLPQILVSLVPVDVSPFLPTSIMGWAMGLVVGTDPGFVTPIVWAVSVVALAGFASRRMERIEFWSRGSTPPGSHSARSTRSAGRFAFDLSVAAPAVALDCVQYVDNYAERVDAAAVSTLMTEPAAAALIVVDETNRATLSEIARVTGRPLSTVQRAVDGLLDAGILGRPTPRAPVRFAKSAPRDALRRLADWRLGPRAVGDLLERLHDADIDAVFAPPPSIRDPEIRRAWAGAMRSIVSAFHPERVVLFGSQARGDARPGSDVDLLVVFDKVEDRRERRVQLRRVLNHQPFAKDVLVADRADISRPSLGSALAEALREGVTVYER